jgi:ubiquinone biosynthesis protein
MSSASRLARIGATVLQHRLDELIDRTGVAEEQLPAPLRFIWRISPTRWLPTPHDPPAHRLRLALESLGPVFIKFGQILSTRRDLLPSDYAEELAKLQDRVPPFPGTEARAKIEKSLGLPLTEVFASFDEQPLASASVAQVHAATLRSGDDVVVKVVRPGIEETIREDLKLLHTIARVLERVSSDARRLHLTTIAEDYEYTILNELNLIHEGANTAKLRRNFAESPLLYVPRVHWDYTRKDVLVLERIHGVPIADTAQLITSGTDMKLLAERGVETFFTQVFVDNYFHADMHPGNIFVDISNPRDPRYIAIDCAIIGSLTEEDQNYLARNLLAFFNQDYREVARLHLESGWIPEDTNVTEFENVIRQVCEPIFEKPLKEISFGHFLVTLFQTARQFNMEVQPQLVLLQKTLLNIEGLGRQLYPDLDLWHTAKPFMERWMEQRMGPAAMLRQFSAHAPELIEQLPRLPELIIGASQGLKRLDRIAREQRAVMNRLAELIENQQRRGQGRRWFGAALLLVSGALLWAPVANALQNGEPMPITVGVLAAVIGSMLIART